MFGSGYIVKKEERFSLNPNLFPLLYHHKSIKYDSYLHKFDSYKKYYRTNGSKIEQGVGPCSATVKITLHSLCVL